MTQPSQEPHQTHPLLAGCIYFAIVFGTGFVLGTIRVLWLVPQVGEEAAVLIEMPVIIGTCIAAAWWLTARYAISTLGAALTMGTLAFALLMAAELALSITAFAQSPSEWLAALFVPPGLWGLIGQIAFGLFPAIAVAFRRRA